MGRAGKALALGAAALAMGGCELQEVTIVDARDVVVVESYVQLSPPNATGDRVTAFLHRTLEGATGASRPVPGAAVVVSKQDGATLELAETSLDQCVRTTPVDGTGTCYWGPAGGRIASGDTLDLEITLADGGILTGRTVVPGAFELLTPPPPYATHPPYCLQAASTPLEMVWTRSEGAWAYVNETFLLGLEDALGAKGITPDGDALYLLGASVSAQDTTIVFPGEFGVFNRFELDQDVALELQKGLPAGANAYTIITAADRNYVNWVRGGNFNPSGQVRIPSVRGDGTGVFGSSVSRSVRIHTDPFGVAAGSPSCGG